MMFTRQQVLCAFFLACASILLSFFFGYLVGRFEVIEDEKMPFEAVGEVN